MEIRSAYDGKVVKVTVECKEPGVTKQSFKDECDVNKIVARFQKTGVLPEPRRQGVYADVSNVGEYRDVLHRVRGAEWWFQSLSPELQERFRSASGLLDFVADAVNEDEAVKLGLLLPVARPSEPPQPPNGKPAVASTPEQKAS